LTISYNALYTNDSSLISSLNSKSPDWRNTQTIAPVGLAAAHNQSPRYKSPGPPSCTPLVREGI